MTRAIYTYADNNPLNRHDPLGLWSWNPAEWNDNEMATVGYVLGGIGLAVGLLAFVAAAPVALVLTGVAVGASMASAAISAGPCSRGQKLACGGMILSGASLSFSLVGRISSVAAGEALGYEVMSTMLGGGGFALDTLDYMGTGEVSTTCK